MNKNIVLIGLMLIFLSACTAIRNTDHATDTQPADNSSAVQNVSAHPIIPMKAFGLPGFWSGGRGRPLHR